MTPLTVVAGFTGAGKTTAIRRWLRTRPVGERWAVLLNGLGAGLSEAALGADVDLFTLTTGCACCAAPVVLRPVLHRVVRRGPFDRVILELAGMGDAAAMVDRLRESAQGTPLFVESVIAVVDARRPAAWADDAGELASLARAQSDCADLILVSHTGSDRREVGLHERLAAGLFGPRPVRAADAHTPDWAQVREALRETAGGMQTEDACPAVALPAGGRRCMRTRADTTVLEWHWPASTRFERRAAEAWTQRASASGALPGSLGVFPTMRDWYLWAPASGLWQPCGWRRDARVVCRFRRPPSPACLEALEHGLLAALHADGA